MSQETSFFAMSEKMKASKSTATMDLWASIEPMFEACPPGKSFAVNLAGTAISDQALRTLISRKAKLAGKTFRVVKHDAAGLFEVGRPELARTPIKPMHVPINGWGDSEQDS